MYARLPFIYILATLNCNISSVEDISGKLVSRHMEAPLVAVVLIGISGIGAVCFPC